MSNYQFFQFRFWFWDLNPEPKSWKEIYSLCHCVLSILCSVQVGHPHWRGRGDNQSFCHMMTQNDKNSLLQCYVGENLKSAISLKENCLKEYYTITINHKCLDFLIKCNLLCDSGFIISISMVLPQT